MGRKRASAVTDLEKTVCKKTASLVTSKDAKTIKARSQKSQKPKKLDETVRDNTVGYRQNTLQRQAETGDTNDLADLVVNKSSEIGASNSKTSVQAKKRRSVACDLKEIETDKEKLLTSQGSSLKRFRPASRKSKVQPESGVAAGARVVEVPGRKQSVYKEACGEGSRSLAMKNEPANKADTLRRLDTMALTSNTSMFSKRVSCLKWHPTEETVMAVGSKDGGIFTWDVQSPDSTNVVDPGPGAGNVLQSLFYLPWDYDKLLTAGMDGTVSIRNVHTKTKQNLQVIPFTGKNWFQSATASLAHKLICSSDNLGNLMLLSPDGSLVVSCRGHKAKINTLEFHPKAEHLLCTASSDKFVRFWDVRAIKDKSSFLFELPHIKGVNAAYFSGSSACRLLTTDQHSQIRVYKEGGSSFNGSGVYSLERTIIHPHRFFQHITPIRAAWHPREDIVVIGRYPDPKSEGYTVGERRTVDLIDGVSGEICCQLSDKSAPGLMSLNQFNCSGEYLASTMGPHVLVWQPKEELPSRSPDLTSGDGAISAGDSEDEEEFIFRPV